MADKTLQLIIQMQAQDAIKQLSTMSDEIKSLSSALGDNSSVSAELSGIFSTLEDGASRTRAELQLFGSADESVARQQQLIKDAMIDLVSRGMDPQSEAVQKLKAQYDQLGTSTQKVGGFFSSMAGQFMTGQFAYNMAAKALRSFIALMKESAELARNQDKVEKELSAAVAMNPMYQPGAAARLRDFAGALQQVTVHGDETTMSLMKTLVATGRTEEEVKKIIKTAADLDATGIMSYDAAVQALNMSYSGMTETLGHQFQELKELSKEELEAGKAVDILAEKVKGYAETSATTGAGSVKQLKNAFGDLKEELGIRWEAIWAPHRNEITKTIQKWTDLLKEAREYTKYKKLNISEETQTLESLQGQRNQELVILQRYRDAYGRGNDPVGKQLIADQEKKIAELNALISKVLYAEDFEFQTAQAEQAAADRAKEEAETAAKEAKQAEELAKQAEQAHQEWIDSTYSRTAEGQLKAKEAEFRQALADLAKATPGTEAYDKARAIKDLLADEIMEILKMGGSALQAVDSVSGDTFNQIKEQIKKEQDQREKEEFDNWFANLYSGTVIGQLEAKETEFQKVLAALDAAEVGSEEYQRWVAIKDKMAEDIMELRSMGGSALQQVSAAAGSTYARTYKQVMDEMTSYSEVFNQKVYESLRNITDMSEETAAVVTNMLGNIADEGFNRVIEASKEFGAAMEDGKLSASEFQEILARQAEAILDMLPSLFLQAGLQLIANGQWALGLGFVAAAGSTAVISGYVGAKRGEARSARGNVFEDGNLVRFARGGVATSPQHFMLGDGRTAEWAEAGPEAIMPLKRLSDGTLGVHAEGGGETKVNIVINNLTGEVVETKETTGADGSRELEITIGKFLKQAASDGTLDSPLSSRYGIRPKGVR